MCIYTCTRAAAGRELDLGARKPEPPSAVERRRRGSAMNRVGWSHTHAHEEAMHAMAGASEKEI